ncbi:MAG: Hsp70 family protein [Deltaproteobacteria bacterium]|nr:Hsp70 family protein [Deltaproteobacteria bacterium]
MATRPGDDLILGIDLGTTFSAMATVDLHGHARVIPNADGHNTTPSVVYFYDADDYAIGEEAARMVLADPSAVARFVKRSMGEPDFTMEFFGRSFTPQEMSAIILRRLKQDAEEALGREIHSAVISVPAYFNAPRRGATAEAGAIAGFDVLSLVNEPTAAAIAYGLDRVGDDRLFMVFDLGGGTLDVTVMSIEGNQLRTVAIDGNAELGGKDWDDRLVNHVAEIFLREHGVDPRDEPIPYQELYERCLLAKISLSTKPRAMIPVNFRGHRMAVTVTEEEFTALTQDLVGQCAQTCGLVMEKASLSWNKLHDVVLVGGSTRMPMIRRMLTNLTGRLPNTSLNPDECVAQGAAVAAVYRHQPDHPAHRTFQVTPSQAAEKTPVPGTGGLPAIHIVDTSSHPLGVIVLDSAGKERVASLLPEGTPLPAERRGRFAYAYDGMTTVRVDVTEGKGSTRDEVTVVGTVVLDRLPPRPRGTPIDVVYRYTGDQVLQVDVQDVETGASRAVRILLRGALGPERVEQARVSLDAARVR